MGSLLPESFLRRPGRQAGRAKRRAMVFKVPAEERSYEVTLKRCKAYFLVT